MIDVTSTQFTIFR